MKLQMFGTVGRATVPAETGRHGGRPYDSTIQSFFFDLLAVFWASAAAYMKLHKILTANRRISNIEPQNVEGWNRSAQSFFYKIDRMPYFDIRYSLFDIRFFKVSFSI